MKIAVCFLSKYPVSETITFAEEISKETNFDVFIVSDEKFRGRDKVSIYPNFHIVHVDDEFCQKKHYVNCNISNTATHIKKNPIAWDKMLYFFCEVYVDYDFVWVFEDDVFIPSIYTIIKLHEKYGHYDLVTPNNFEKTDKLKDWHWKHIFNSIQPPYFYSMVCACGLSKNMFKEIKKYADFHHHLFYIEAIFNTLANQSGLKVIDAFELKSIVWEGKWGIDEFLLLPDNVFHPLKVLTNYPLYRAKIEKAKAENYIPINNLPDFLKNPV